MKKKQRVSIEIVHVPANAQHYLILSTPGWFNIVEITEQEAEKTSRLHSIEIQKKITI